MRRYLTKPERIAMVFLQNHKCGCGCGQPVDAETGEGEHYVCVWFGNDGKPDAIWRPDCHKVKTANDKKLIAKVKRLIRKANGTWRPNRKKIASQPFPARPEGMKHHWPSRPMASRPMRRENSNG